MADIVTSWTVPVGSAYFWLSWFGGQLAWMVFPVTALLAVAGGLLLSALFDLAPGATIVVTAAALFGVSAAVGRLARRGRAAIGP